MPCVTTNRPIRRGYDVTYDYESAYCNEFLRKSACLIGQAIMSGKDISDAYAAPAAEFEISVEDFTKAKVAAEKVRRAELEFNVIMAVARNRREIDAIECAARSFNLTAEEVAAIVKDMIKD